MPALTRSITSTALRDGQVTHTIPASAHTRPSGTQGGTGTPQHTPDETSQPFTAPQTVGSDDPRSGLLILGINTYNLLDKEAVTKRVIFTKLRDKEAELKGSIVGLGARAWDI